MKKFNEYTQSQLTEAKYGAIYEPKNIKTYEDALDPEVLIKGMGRLLLSQIKRKILDKYKELELDMRLSANPASVGKGHEYGQDHLNKIQNNLIYFVGALADAEKEMNSSQYKRKLTMLKKKR
tara:strand:- start:40 stop:408 length:369 start_codon:yes stop_codon:yes gene_type:complete